MDSRLIKVKKFRQPTRLPDQVADFLAAEIRKGTFQVGEKLPPEAALAERFGVSRTVIREALGRLKYDGLLDSRQGIGATVVGDRSSRAFRLETFDEEKLRDWEQLYELRSTLEAEAAALAAERRGEEDLTRLKDCLRAIQEAADQRIERTAADAGFHRCVARASQNVYLAELMNFLIDTVIRGFLKVWENLDREPGLPRIILQEHTAIFEAIEAQDPLRARQATLTHLRNSARLLRPKG